MALLQFKGRRADTGDVGDERVIDLVRLAGADDLDIDDAAFAEAIAAGRRAEEAATRSALRDAALADLADVG
jgi:hypothetical protein